MATPSYSTVSPAGSNAAREECQAMPEGSGTERDANREVAIDDVVVRLPVRQLACRPRMAPGRDARLVARHVA